MHNYNSNTFESYIYGFAICKQGTEERILELAADAIGV
jgi:hypothetical protein